MNIIPEQINDNHLKLVVNVEPDDYLNDVDEEIKSLSRKITMNGFRPGKVPVGLTKKFYGNSVLADHLDKLINSTLSNYIKEKDLQVLGQPLPYEVKHQQINVLRPEPYDFGFELGLIPVFELPDLEHITFEKKLLHVTDKMIEEEIDRLCAKYGERSNPDVIGDGDIVYGEWKELNDNGELKENGISSTSSFSIKLVKDDGSAQLLKKLSKNESVEINVRTAFSNDMELIIHSILKTDHNTAGQMNERFRFTLLNITHIDKAALHQQLFDLAFGKAEINSEDELRSRVKSDLENEYLKYTSSKLDRAIQEYLLNHTNMSLPVEFLRKLINSNKEGAEDITEQQMNQHMNQVKWDLIHDRIVRENELSVAREELIDYIKLDILNYYKNEMSEDEEALSRLVNSLLNDEKYVRRISDQVLNDKVFELLKSKISIEEKAVDLHEFYHH